ncbi:hypothetical protein OSCI_3230003 [Kamptonema sp. PCC 6506]|nr:hypothetical protein OSCI_3230003 [Kamptonema sp. PCC 6506]
MCVQPNLSIKSALTELEGVLSATVIFGAAIAPTFFILLPKSAS